MNSRRINLVLWSAVPLLGAGAVAAVVVALVWPLEQPPPEQPRPARKLTVAAEDGAGALPPLSAFEPIWQSPLRRRLGNKAAAPTPAQAAAAAAAASAAPVTDQPPPVTLVGTIGHSLAMLRRNKDNVIEARTVGEKVAGVEVLAVRPSQVDLRFEGRRITLQMALSKPAK
jgi:hypothetical protein